MPQIVGASVIGTMIEWYDFLLYGTAAELVFNKLFFPSFDPFVGTLAAFGSYAVGFVARPLGGAIFGHFGDKIGRKTMFDADHDDHRSWYISHRLSADLQADRRLGADHVDWPSAIAGYRHRRRMGRRDLDGDRARTTWQARLFWQLGASWSPTGRCDFHRRIPSGDADAGGGLPQLGLADAIPDQHRLGRSGPIHPNEIVRDTGIQAHPTKPGNCAQGRCSRSWPSSRKPSSLPWA
jgi:hypothetical protein